MFTKDLIDLNSYIKCDFIKESFNKSYNIIDSIEEAEKYAKLIRNGQRINLLFESSFLKEHFFTILKSYDINMKIINCNSNYNRFLEDYEHDNNTLYIYNNINNCKDLNILNLIKENIGVFIC